MLCWHNGLNKIGWAGFLHILHEKICKLWGFVWVLFPKIVQNAPKMDNLGDFPSLNILIFLQN